MRWPRSRRPWRPRWRPACARCRRAPRASRGTLCCVRASVSPPCQSEFAAAVLCGGEAQQSMTSFHRRLVGWKGSGAVVRTWAPSRSRCECSRSCGASKGRLASTPMGWCAPVHPSYRAHAHGMRKHACTTTRTCPPFEHAGRAGRRPTCRARAHALARVLHAGAGAVRGLA